MAWLTTPLESAESGNLVMGTVRTDVEKQISNPRFRYRVEATWSYTPATSGMPDEETSELMEQVQEAFDCVIHEKDSVMKVLIAFE